MRAIDADWVIGALNVFSDKEHGNRDFLLGIASAKEIIENASTIEPAPTAFIPAFTITSTDGQAEVRLVPERHGKWIKDGEASALYKCSKCGTLCSLVGYANCIPIEQMNKTMKYCNSCGAKMDEVEE